MNLWGHILYLNLNSHFGSREQPSPDTKTAGTFTLGFPASRMVRNKFLMFIHFPVCGILLQQHKWPKIACSITYLQDVNILEDPNSAHTKMV
jgi:hypothetical protein